MSEHETAQTVDLPVPPDLTGRADGEFSSLINRPLLPANPTETARIWFAMARRGLYAFDGVITTGRTTGLRD